MKGLIPATPLEFIATCQRCDRLEHFWTQWSAEPFPSLEDRALDVERLLAAATTEAEEQFALDRARGDGLAWIPRALVEDLTAMAARVTARRYR
jgi:hypothetical protein